MRRSVVIDGLQYCNYSEAIFRDLRAGGVDAIHVTIAYHEDFRETVANIVRWNGLFAAHTDLIFHARAGEDVRRAAAEGRIAVFFGLQNCSPIEDDIGLVEVCHALGVRFMQLSYNNQSLLASGCYERVDAGITRMGREVIAEMNRLGMVIDMSHSGPRSTLEAIELSSRPIAVTHANPHRWHPVVRNKPDDVLKALAGTGGMLGFSLYPHHLKDGSACTLAEFCAMVARTAELTGVGNLGLGSDLCQNQPDAVVQWMRRGSWTKEPADPGNPVVFPPQPDWFRSNRDFPTIAEGLGKVGFAKAEVDAIMGGNWLRFFDLSFSTQEPGK
ncbi:membrane dipeptidase [Taklimakanibacter lacteus]|uniref:membrane dipeptidase n=1 Tax=Taklimakanibacter lacteus TaxID=2268456 RepID=UPI0034D6878B